MEKEEREINGGGKMKEGVEVIITWTLMTVPEFLTHTHSQHLTMSKCCAELESTLKADWHSELMLKYCVREMDCFHKYVNLICFYF